MKLKMTVERDPEMSVEQVIVARFMRGDGSGVGASGIVRQVTQVRKLDGELIAENDPFPGEAAVRNP